MKTVFAVLVGIFAISMFVVLWIKERNEERYSENPN